MAVLMISFVSSRFLLAINWHQDSSKMQHKEEHGRHEVLTAVISVACSHVAWQKLTFWRNMLSPSSEQKI
jgi:hypothetical protein